MINIKEYILDIFFPKKCIICSRTLEAGCEISVCGKCEENMILKFHNPHLPDIRYFDEHMFCMPYIDNIKNSVLSLKFKNHYTLAKTFGYIMAKRLNEENTENVDMVVPVPISYKRKRDRGYNQTELITKELCKETGLMMRCDVLIKTKEIPPISSMNKTEREKAVKGAYEVLSDIKGMTILLTDDIYTTGSTVNECARVLKKKGAKEVRVLTLCTGVTKEEARLYRETLVDYYSKKFFDLF